MDFADFFTCDPECAGGMPSTRRLRSERGAMASPAQRVAVDEPAAVPRPPNGKPEEASLAEAEAALATAIEFVK